MKKTMLKTHFVYSLLFVLLIALDRVTKNWASHTLIKQDIDVIPDVLCFHYLENAGAAWGILQNAILAVCHYHDCCIGCYDIFLQPHSL